MTSLSLSKQLSSACICPANVPACPSCGRKWSHYLESDSTRTYTDAATVARYEALYRERPFKEVS